MKTYPNSPLAVLHDAARATLPEAGGRAEAWHEVTVHRDAETALRNGLHERARARGVAVRIDACPLAAGQISLKLRVQRRPASPANRVGLIALLDEIRPRAASNGLDRALRSRAVRRLHRALRLGEITTGSQLAAAESTTPKTKRPA